LREIGDEVVLCKECVRLGEYLDVQRQRYPDYWNRPVPSFGDPRAPLAIVGLAPGLHGANRSGRPFYMDASGEWLYGELERLGVWNGSRLSGALILNVVKCVPPQNRPLTEEVDRCRTWLSREFEALRDVRIVLALGAIAHRSLLALFGARPFARYPFRHGGLYRLPDRPILLSSYHPSRQNTNTGVLTRRMWSSILRKAVRLSDVSESD
jgi:uracil-DNA glycosylase family 4